jgi:hypothetical protein
MSETYVILNGLEKHSDPASNHKQIRCKTFNGSQVDRMKAVNLYGMDHLPFAVSQLDRQ